MIANGAVAYRKVQITTSSPVQMVVQLYEGAIRFTTRAIQAIEVGDHEAAHLALLRSQAILTELRATLNPEAGDVAQGLELVYASLYGKLVRANVRKDAAPAREVIHYLEELLGAWQGVLRQSAGETPVPVLAGGSAR